MSDKCRRCRFAVPVYMGDGDELLTACVYILRTGKRRPYPPGEDCRVYEPAQINSHTQEQREEIFE